MDGLSSDNLLLEKNVTISTIRTKLSLLDTYILSIGGDIMKFNTYVKGLV